MSDETRNPEQPNDDEPQVFAVSKHLGGKWKFNRRDFVKAAGAIAAAGGLVGCGSESDSSVVQAPNIESAKAHNDHVTDLYINPIGMSLISIAARSIKIWSLSDRALMRTLDERNVTSLAISPDGTRLATGDSSHVVLRSFPDGDELVSLWSYLDSVYSLAFSPNGTRLASGNFHGNINLWSIPDGELIQTLKHGYYGTRSLAFSPDGRVLASGGEGGISLFFGTLSKNIETLGSVNSIAFSPDGASLASASDNDNIKLWSLPDGALMQTLDEGANSIAISPDGTLLASASDNDDIKLWSLPGGTLKKTLKGHTNNVLSVAISSDGVLLASGSMDHHIKLWSLPEGDYVGDLIDIAACEPDFEGALFSPNDEGSSVITLPCGSPIPVGSTCICNCVSGSGCSCVGYRFSPPSCSCVGYGFGLHYWYPN